jgi:hypothetical protein
MGFVRYGCEIAPSSEERVWWGGGPKGVGQLESWRVKSGEGSADPPGAMSTALGGHGQTTREGL